MRIFILLFAVLLSGCSSIVSGTTQTLTVNTSPEGANCKFFREGLVIGEVSQTPGSVLVKKTKHDITVECTKKGYEKTTYFNKSDIEGATVGNVILGGGIGWAIDSASGADNKYTEIMNITLPKK
jgi:hypothetical protein